MDALEQAKKYMGYFEGLDANQPYNGQLAQAATAYALIALVERLDKLDKPQEKILSQVAKLPKWDYICPNCGIIKNDDVRQSMNEENLLTCALCGSDQVTDAPF